MEDNENIFFMIQQCYSSLSKTQRRIADYLLQHPNTGCFLTLKQLSKETHTTEATILSFSRSIGCDSFSDMRTKLQSYISQWMFPSARLKISAFSEDVPDSVSAAVINSELNALKQSYEHISDQDIDQVLTLLHAARRVYVLASDYTTAVSNVFVERFSRLGLDVRNVGGLEVSPTLYHLAQMGEEDLLVLFSYAPYTRLLFTLAQHLRTARGVRVLCFSDSLSSPGIQCADAALASVNSSPIFFNSITAPISLINLLACTYVSTYVEEYSAFDKSLSDLQRAVISSCPGVEHWGITSP